MPKPRTEARLRRRAARDLATRNAAAALAELIANPPPELPADLVEVYRDQIGHHPPHVGLARTSA